MTSCCAAWIPFASCPCCRDNTAALAVPAAHMQAVWPGSACSPLCDHNGREGRHQPAAVGMRGRLQAGGWHITYRRRSSGCFCCTRKQHMHTNFPAGTASRMADRQQAADTVSPVDHAPCGRTLSGAAPLTRPPRACCPPSQTCRPPPSGTRQSPWAGCWRPQPRSGALQAGGWRLLAGALQALRQRDQAPGSRLWACDRLQKANHARDGARSRRRAFKRRSPAGCRGRAPARGRAEVTAARRWAADATGRRHALLLATHCIVVSCVGSG